MPAVAEQTVVCPIRCRRADRYHGDVVHEEHNDRENRKAEPTVGDVGLTSTLGLSDDGLLSLLLGADEEDLAALGSGLGQEAVSLVGLDDGALQVEDVDAVALAEDVGLHLGAPTTGLVTEVNASLQKGVDSDLSHFEPPWFDFRTMSTPECDPTV